MQFAFQDFEHLYLVMDLLTGGDLRYHVSRHRKFSEEQTSNYICLMFIRILCLLHIISFGLYTYE